MMKIILRKKIIGYQGFTLIELIFVMLILSIIASTGSRFIVSAMDSYALSAKRADLLKRGRIVTEKITRLLRNSLPNSVRVSASGYCMEFIPIVGGSYYEDDIPVSGDSNAITSLTTAPFDVTGGTGRYLSIAAYDSSELYLSPASPGALVNIGNMTGVGITALGWATPHQFIRHSLSQRVYLIDNPQRICINASNEIRIHRNYGLPTSALTDAPPNTGDLLSDGIDIISEVPFSLSPAAVNRNAVIRLSLPFLKGKERVVIDHRVYIRNVP